MAEYTVKLRRTYSSGSPVPAVEVDDALREFEAAAVGLNEFRARGERFDAETGVEIVQETVTETSSTSRGRNSTRVERRSAVAITPR